MFFTAVFIATQIIAPSKLISMLLTDKLSSCEQIGHGNKHVILKHNLMLYYQITMS